MGFTPNRHALFRTHRIESSPAAVPVLRAADSVDGPGPAIGRSLSAAVGWPHTRPMRCSRDVHPVTESSRLEEACGTCLYHRLFCECDADHMQTLRRSGGCEALEQPGYGSVPPRADRLYGCHVSAGGGRAALASGKPSPFPALNRCDGKFQRSTADSAELACPHPVWAAS